MWVYGWSEHIFELGYAQPILPRCHKVNIIYVAGFGVMFWGKKSGTSMIPIIQYY